jgi:HEAT repeat protein
MHESFKHKIMKNHAEELKELKKLGISGKKLKLLTDLISTDNYMIHGKAKEKLLKKGEDILPLMHKLSGSRSDLLRREAAKILKLLPDESSIPFAIILLEDRVSEIRWIAAEILISVGRSSIRPLLRELVKNGASFFLRHGAHHVLSELLVEEDPEELKNLLHVSLSGNELPGRVPVKAAQILKKHLVQ